MTELLENSDNTNESAVVSESPANEATISLAVAQSLADALQKIESYTPTVWVDNESPDIDAAHLNKAEQAITRVTTAMNSAVDVIKDLQSQVNTTNNNLSNISSSIRVNFKKRDSTTVQLEGYTEGNVDGINIQATKDGKFYASGKFDGTWNSSVGLATKDDLTKSIDFRGNAKALKVRSGTDGLKNIYLDIEDESGNTCSLAFISDGESAVKLTLNGKTVWTK